MMSNLRRRFAPSDKAREQDVLTAWKKAIKKPTKGTEIEKWVQDLETAYDRAVELNLPAISGINPHYELIWAISDLTPELAGNLKIKLSEIINDDAELVLLREEIRKFRNLWRINRAFERPGPSHGAFTASL